MRSENVATGVSACRGTRASASILGKAFGVIPTEVCKFLGMHPIKGSSTAPPLEHECASMIGSCHCRSTCTLRLTKEGVRHGAFSAFGILSLGTQCGVLREFSHTGRPHVGVLTDSPTEATASTHTNL